MLSRREWLARVFGATVAAAVAPLVDLTDTTPAFWNQPAIKPLMPWRISFPDGTTWTFDAVVVSEKMLDNGNVEFSVQPTGPLTLVQERSDLNQFQEHVLDSEHERPIPVTGTRLITDKGIEVELQEISMPSLERNDIEVSSRDHYDGFEHHIPGLQRVGTLTMEVHFTNGKVDI